MGLLLICYKGHGNISVWKNDNLLTNISGIMALGVAFIPTNPDVVSDKIYTLIPLTENWIGWLYYGFAAFLFLIFSLLAARKTIPEHQKAL